MKEGSKFVKDFVRGHNGLLISILDDIQEHYGYLPEDVLRELSKELEIPLRDIYGVATFYKAFKLHPRGKHLITVCLGTTCHVRGGPRVLEEFERALNIKAGETTKDLQFTLETVNCLGACALGPVVVVDGKYYGKMNPAKVKSLLKKFLREEK